MLSFLSNKKHATTRSLIVAISCAAVCGIHYGLSAPLISLRLEHMTGSGIIIGLNGAVAALAILMMAPIVPRIMGLLSSRRILILSLVCAAGLISLFTVFQSVSSWYVLRFLDGAFMTVIFVISESWINQIVTPKRRAFMLGVYGTALAGGFGIGALIFASIDASTNVGFYYCSLVMLLGILPIVTLNGPSATAPAPEDSDTAAMVRAAGVAPAAIVAALAFGALETLMFSMIPVYGDRLDMSTDIIGMLMFAAAMGGIFIQIPIGWIADRTDRRGTLVWIALVTATLPIMMLVSGTALVWLIPLLFVQAGISGGLYIVGLALLGERFTGGAIAAANAAFIFAYGLGSLLGPPAAGLAMDTIGPQGLMLVLAAISGLYFLFLIFPRTRTQLDS